jgi:hypothetical protein
VSVQLADLRRDAGERALRADFVEKVEVEGLACFAAASDRYESAPGS